MSVPKFKTQKEVDCQMLTVSKIEAIAPLFDHTSYSVYHSFAYIDRTEDEKGKFVGFAGAMKAEDACDVLYDLEFPKNTDIYVTANGTKNFSRKSENLIGIQNLVIDIDAHDSDLNTIALNKHIDEFEQILLKKLALKPNYINHTGRGMHLWYSIEPCYVALKDICISAIRMIIDQVKKIMKETNETILDVDTATSIKLNGLFRMPGSYNTKAKMWSFGKAIHSETPHVNDIISAFRKAGCKAPYVKKEEKVQKVSRKEIKRVKLTCEKSLTGCLIKRKNFMDYLFKTRHVTEGSRDKMLFAMYSVLHAMYEEDEAREYLLEINDNFDKPLPYNEIVNNIFLEIETKNHKFRIWKFLDFVEATPAERAWFEKHGNNKEAKRKAEVRERKDNRDTNIINLYTNGMSISGIMKETGVSRPTIAKILKEANIYQVSKFDAKAAAERAKLAAQKKFELIKEKMLEIINSKKEKANDIILEIQKYIGSDFDAKKDELFKIADSFIKEIIRFSGPFSPGLLQHAT